MRGCSRQVNDAKRKAKRAAYYQRPEVNAYMRSYYRAYRQRPEVKAKRIVHDQSPKYKAYKRAYMHTYQQRPEVMARRWTHPRLGGPWRLFYAVLLASNRLDSF